MGWNNKKCSESKKGGKKKQTQMKQNADNEMMDLNSKILVILLNITELNVPI